MTDKEYLDSIAPDLYDSKVPRTAENVMRNDLVQAFIAARNSHAMLPDAYTGDREDKAAMFRHHAAYLCNFGELAAAWVSYKLLRKLREIDPTVADQMAAEIVGDFEAGDGFGEWTWQWCAEEGWDVERLATIADDHASRRGYPSTGETS